MFLNSHTNAAFYGGRPVTGDGTTDMEQQFQQAVGRPMLESEVDASILAWESKSYDQFRAWAASTFPRDVAPAASDNSGVVGLVVLAAIAFWAYKS